MSIVWLIIVGAAAGFLATRLMRIEADIVTTVVIGIAGAVIGGLILRAILVVGGLLAGLVGAVLGALLLIWLWQKYVRK
jgi:uncharacterized membrane protein YeaQ/YmgE (transglycosylase-associated protein family)